MMKDEKQPLLAQYAVPRALAESASLDEATPEILRAICEGLGWQFGALRVVDREADVLPSIRSWRNSTVELAEFEKLSQQPAFARGEGLPGRVWASGEPEWVTDIAANRNYPRSAIASEAGLHCAFGANARRSWHRPGGDAHAPHAGRSPGGNYHERRETQRRMGNATLKM